MSETEATDLNSEVMAALSSFGILASRFVRKDSDEGDSLAIILSPRDAGIMLRITSAARLWVDQEAPAPAKDEISTLDLSVLSEEALAAFEASKILPSPLLGSYGYPNSPLDLASAGDFQRRIALAADRERAARMPGSRRNAKIAAGNC